MLNERGGIECDFTVTRLAEDRFRIVTGTAFGQHDLAWIASHAPEDGSVHVEDVTSRFACLGLWGPRAREILQPLTTADLSNDAFPLHARAGARGRPGPVPRAARDLRRASSAGSSTARPSSASALWDALWEAGREHGLVAGGYRAIDSCRLEKGYRVWGADITPGRHALGGGARLRGEARQGRLHRARRPARAAGAGAEARVPRPRRPARRRARLRARPPRRQDCRPGHERRLRLHGGALDRVRLRAGRPTPSPDSRSRSRSSASGSPARSRASRCTTRTECGVRA